MQEITDRLFEMQDLKYKEFHQRLIPNIDPDTVIGVRMPALRIYAKELVKAGKAHEFFRDAPHYYYDEKTLHGIMIGLAAKTPSEALKLIDEFLPYVDNWATCDSMPPKILKKDLKLLRRTIMPWLDSNQTYRVRFAVVAMLQFLLEDEFEATDLERLADIKSEEYYINMAIAWYYSFALIKQYDETIGGFEGKTLDKWIHNKSIQKAVESYRITKDKKDYLRTLRIK